MKSNQKWAYLVYCNPQNPLVYGVYSSKKAALDYAHSLIKWREDRAKERGYEFGFYHYFAGDGMKETDMERREKCIFSTCLKIKDKNIHFSEDHCNIQVIRRPLLK